MTRSTILVVDDDDRLRATLEMLIGNLGHEVLMASDVGSAELVLAKRDADVVISDLRMPGGSGIDLLESIKRSGRETPVIMLTAYGTVETAVEAMRKGAFDFLLKPFETSEIEVRIERALAYRRYQTEHAFLREEIEQGSSIDEMIGVSPALQKVVELVKQVAPSKASVLITGETGTGKELVARAIHRRSPRQDRLLVPVNLAAVPTELLESELFGHVRGAFTSAIAERTGRFELAHEGTLFLDEVGDAPLALQPKILRVLQDGVVEISRSSSLRDDFVRICTTASA
jgi:two-component system response regulator AtoC